MDKLREKQFPFSALYPLAMVLAMWIIQRSLPPPPEVTALQ